MRHANAPSGPANPRAVRTDAAAQQEELDELTGDAAGGNATLSSDAGTDARHAERNAHAGEQNVNATGVGRSRPMPKAKEPAMEGNTTWVVVADEGRARILSRSGPGEDLRELATLEDPAAHAHNADFRHDAYGRRAPGGAARPSSVASSAGEEKLDHEAELFAHRLALRLADAHRAHRFDALCIAAAPRFLGRLRKALDAEVSALVEAEIDKDLLQLDARALTLRLYGNAAGPRH